jgi:FixJ family two-component response regulator
MSTAVSPGYSASSAQVIRSGFKSSSASEATPIIFVLDVDEAARESLALLILAEGWRCETFASAQEFFARPAALVPNCLVLDVSSCRDALEVQRRIVCDRPGASVIFTTGNIDVATTVRAIKAGAVEFFTKPVPETALVNSLREALKCSLAALRQEADKKMLQDRYASLTPREREVMALVVAGRLNKQVGGELGISEITVKAHRGQVMQKMKADSLAGLVKMASRLSVAV